MKQKIFSLVLILSLLLKVASAQVYPLQVHVQIQPPYSSYIRDYVTDMSKVTLNVQNTSATNSYKIYFGGRLRNSDGSIAATLLPSNRPSQYIEILPLQNLTLNRNDLQPLYNPSNLSYTGISNEMIAAGVIPDGNYSYCVTAYDWSASTVTLLSSPPDAGASCAMFMLRMIEPPQLAQPLCSSRVNAITPQNVVLSWTMPAGINMVGADIEYHLKVVEVPDGMTPNDAMTNSTNIIIDQYTKNLLYNITSTDLALESGKRYAYQVQVKDNNAVNYFKENGFSTVCYFDYGNAHVNGTSSAFTTQIYFPQINMWNPWTTFPVIVQYDPYSNDYRRFNTDFNISTSDVPAPNNSEHEARQIDWPQGPLNTQQDVTLLADIDKHRASQIIVNQSHTSAPAWLVNNSTYNVDGTCIMKDNSNNTYNASVNSIFKAGMSSPTIHSPNDNDTIATSSSVGINFKTADKPALLQPEMDLVRNDNTTGNTNLYYTQGVINQRWVLQTSRQSDFGGNGADIHNSNIRDTVTGTVFANWAEIRSTPTIADDRIYTDLTKNLDFSHAQDTGWWYVRVGWAVDRNNLNAGIYNTVQKRFFIGNHRTGGGGSTPHDEESPAVSPDCNANCTYTPGITETAADSNHLAVNDSIRVGLFSMKIATVTNNSSNGHGAGTGTIYVPFLHCKVKVAFNNLKAHRLGNNLFRFFDGTVKATVDSTSLINPTIANDTMIRRVIPGLSQNTITSINHAASGVARLIGAGRGEPIGMPLGVQNTIDGVAFTVGIVGMSFGKRSASVNAVTSFEIPDLHSTLGLGAGGIEIHPGGLCGGKGMLFLPGDIQAMFGDSTFIGLKGWNGISSGDSGTYVKWNCQGFEELRIKGFVRFSRNVIVPDNTDGTVGAGQVELTISTTIRKPNDFIIEANMPHFQIVGAPGWGFNAENLVLDLSASRNGTDMHFPDGYAAAPYNGTTDATWKGFYMKRLSVSLPPEFQHNTGTGRFTAGIEDLLIDRRGVSGSLFAHNIISFGNGNVDHWAFSLDTFRLTITANSFVSGHLSGGIKIPISDSALYYGATLAMSDTASGGRTSGVRRLNFTFNIHPRADINANLWQATIHLDRSSHIDLTYNGGSGRFNAAATLTGGISVHFDNVGPARNVNLDLLTFQNLVIQTTAPYINPSAVHFGNDDGSPFSSLGGGSGSGSGGHGGNFDFHDFENYAYNERGPNTEQDDEYLMHQSLYENELMDAPSGGGGSGSGSNRRAQGFPIEIRDIGIASGTASDGSPLMGIQFTIAVNITGERNTFGAAASMSILGKLNLQNVSNPIQIWGFDHIQLDGIDISGTVGVVSIDGHLRIYNDDATYGNGFKGNIHVGIHAGMSIDITAMVQSGTVRSNRYWAVDAQVLFSTGISFGQFALYGLGGGASYGMRMQNLPTGANNIMRNASTADASSPSSSNSGVNYIPDDHMGFGFKVKVIFGTSGGGNAFNGDIEFGAFFTRDGGVDSMYLNGNGRFMTQGVTDVNEPQVGCHVGIGYSFSHNIFDGVLNVSANIAGGIIHGHTQPGNVVGTAWIHADGTGLWYIKIGTPSEKLGLDIVLGPLNAQIWMYFMVGMNLPLPTDADLPQFIRDHCTTGISGSTRAGGITSGDGFAMGAGLDFDTGDLQFLIFYARLRLGFGFDLSLVKVPAGTVCDGVVGSVGANGWYAQGRLYAYAAGEIGISVDLWFIHGRYTIIDLGMAGLLQGGFPNPNWFKGNFAAYYNILGGLVHGNCNFEVQQGNRCTPPLENPLAGMNIIADVKPESNAGVDEIMQAAFNQSLDRSFSITETLDNGTDRTRTFKFVLEKFELKNGTATTSAAISYNSNRDQITMLPDNMLLPRTPYTLTCSLVAYEMNSTGTWTQSLKLDGTPVRETKTVNFTTGAYPDHIPESNVVYTYPMLRQRYYLQNECHEGQVFMWQSMDPLLAPAPNVCKTQKLIAKFVPMDGSATLTGTASYNTYTHLVTFRVPQLNNQKIYACQIVMRDSSIPHTGCYTFMLSSIRFMSHATTDTSRYASSVQSGVKTIHKNLDPAHQVNANEHLLYMFFFKTSKYNTFAEKFTNSNSAYFRNVGTNSTDRIDEVGFDTDEPLDYYDLIADNSSRGSFTQTRDPLLGSKIASSKWYTDYGSLIESNSNSLRTYPYYFHYPGYQWISFNQAIPFMNQPSDLDQPLQDYEVRPTNSIYGLSFIGGALLGTSVGGSSMFHFATSVGSSMFSTGFGSYSSSSSFSVGGGSSFSTSFSSAGFSGVSSSFVNPASALGLPNHYLLNNTLYHTCLNNYLAVQNSFNTCLNNYVGIDFGRLIALSTNPSNPILTTAAFFHLNSIDINTWLIHQNIGVPSPQSYRNPTDDCVKFRIFYRPPFYSSCNQIDPSSDVEFLYPHFKEYGYTRGSCNFPPVLNTTIHSTLPVIRH